MLISSFIGSYGRVTDRILTASGNEILYFFPAGVSLFENWSDTSIISIYFLLLACCQYINKNILISNLPIIRQFRYYNFSLIFFYSSLFYFTRTSYFRILLGTDSHWFKQFRSISFQLLQYVTRFEKSLQSQTWYTAAFLCYFQLIEYLRGSNFG